MGLLQCYISVYLIIDHKKNRQPLGHLSEEREGCVSQHTPSLFLLIVLSLLLHNNVIQQYYYIYEQLLLQQLCVVELSLPYLYILLCILQITL